MFHRDHERVQLSSDLPSLTKQAFKKECDINHIMANFEKTGLVSHYNKHQGEYGQFIGAPDYQAAMNLIIKANEMFENLPSKIRARFNNDPTQFLEFAQDPENEAEMVRLGLKRSEKPVEPQVAQTGVPPTPAPPEGTPASPAAPQGAE